MADHLGCSTEGCHQEASVCPSCVVAQLRQAQAEATSLREQRDYATKAVDGLMDRLAALEVALRLILPMAKGYAAEHQVGRNQEMVNEAEQVLTTLPTPGSEGQIGFKGTLHPMKPCTNPKCCRTPGTEGER